jgi:hypothetical protein
LSSKKRQVVTPSGVNRSIGEHDSGASGPKIDTRVAISRLEARSSTSGTLTGRTAVAVAKISIVHSPKAGLFASSWNSSSTMLVPDAWVLVALTGCPAASRKLTS